MTQERVLTLVQMIEQVGVSRIDMRIALSPEWQSMIVEKENIFSIQQYNVDLLREASKALQSVDTPTNARVLGRIKRLETDGNPADLLEDKSRREIEISWANDENRVIQVKVALSPAEYLSAVEAHKQGQAVVAVGLLSKVGRNWRLDPVEKFEVIR